MRTTIMDCLDELASLHTHPPLACGLRSVSMTKSTMSLQGQAEQPMVLRGWSVSSMVPDAPVPWPWMRAAWTAAATSAAGYRPWARSAAGGAPRVFGRIWRGPGAGRVPRPCTLHTLKTANLAHQRPGAAIRRPPLPWNGHTAMPRCPPGQHAAQLRRGASSLRPEPPTCKPHPAHRPRPRPRCWSVRNHGRHAPTAQHHRLLGLALPAHRRPCRGNRSETAVEGRARLQSGQIGHTSHNSRPHRAQPRAA